MNEDHLKAAAGAVALNPASARLVARGTGPVRGLSAHLAGRDDGLVEAPPLLDRALNFADCLDADLDDPAFAALRRNEPIGRPLGDRAFQDAISRRLGRAVTPGKRGPKPKRERDGG